MDAQCQKDTIGKFLLVSCGSEEGKFYAEKLKSPLNKEKVLSNPILAFIKAFRLRGDRLCLCQAVLEKFSEGLKQCLGSLS